MMPLSFHTAPISSVGLVPSETGSKALVETCKENISFRNEDPDVEIASPEEV